MKNISSMAALAALLLVSCGQDTDVKFAGDEGAKVTFSASINEQNSQDVSRVTGVTWDDGDEVSISCGPTQKNVFYRYNAADNSFTAINRFDEIWLLGNEEYDVTAYFKSVFLIEAFKAYLTDVRYKTTFVAGDVVGVYGVAGGQVVEGISNRKFTLNEKGVWELEGNPIEYDSELFKTITFYAYYPYQDNVAFNPAVEDPFADFVANWQIAADQGGFKYTKSDLMTSTSQAEAGRLQGKVTFTMNHRMALAVFKMPKLVYDFTNGGLDDYSLDVAPKELLINDVETTPYYDAASGTYMALVKPETNYSISCTYQGTQEKMINPTGSLAGGKAKMYTIKDENNKLDYTLNIGDYLCADGNLVSVNDGTVPDNAIGVVCYVGNPEPHVTHPNNYTETNDALYRDYPNCTHGLVLALKNARDGQWDGGAFNSTSSSTRSPAYCDWLASDEEWNGLLVPCNTEANGALKNDPESMFPAFLGYNNTLVMTMCYEGKGPQNSCNNAYTYLMNYRNEVAVPSSVTPWYIPSVVCWNEVAKSSSVINKSISKLGEDKGEELVSVSSGTAKNHYWTSTQRNWATQWTHGIDGGRYTQASNKGSLAGHFRMMLAF